MAFALHTGSSRGYVGSQRSAVQRSPPFWAKEVIASQRNCSNASKRKEIGFHISPASERRQKRGRRNRESRNQSTAGGTASGDTAHASVTLAEIRYAGVSRTPRSGRPDYPDPELEFLGRWPSRTSYRRCLCSWRSHPSQYEGGRNRSKCGRFRLSAGT
jgi:hypothetical protein